MHAHSNSTSYFVSIGVPKGIRTPVTAVKGRCPRPLDDGDVEDPFTKNVLFIGTEGEIQCRNQGLGVSRQEFVSGDGVANGRFILSRPVAL